MHQPLPTTPRIGFALIDLHLPFWAITAHAARITGVRVIDRHVAHHLVQVAQAVKFLGASVTLVGIAPEAAQTIVQLGVDLQGLITRSTLQAGLQYARGAL